MIQKSLLIFSVLVLTFTAYKYATLPKQDLSELQSLWSSWKSQYQKSYTAEEESYRFSVFVANHARVMTHNADPTATYEMALNKFADLTGEEFKANYLSGWQADHSIGDPYCPSASSSCPSWPAPTQTTVNWTAAGAVTPIKNQEQCGGCWAFSTTGALEGLYFIQNKVLKSFSEQQLIDCVTTCDGCDGGLPSLALTYTASKGIETEQEYPFVGMNTKCKYTESDAITVNAKGFQCIPQKSVDDLESAVTQQPVSIGVEANQNAWQLYSKGVLSSGCGAELDHAVTLIGYGSYEGTDNVWYVKNQWGTDWGVDGYIYLSQNSEQNTGFGVCGILRCANIPLN